MHYEGLDREARAADQTLERMKHEEAAYRVGSQRLPAKRLVMQSEIGGVVLKRFVDEERILAAGTPLYEIGTFDKAEVTTDVLSTDAPLLTVGMPVIINAGSDKPIAASIARIEPAAFTKVSALGIEEQRVVAVCRPSGKINLGDGYKMSLDVIVWRYINVVRVPSNAIVIHGKDASVFAVVNGSVSMRSLRLGVQGRDFVQVLHGIGKGTFVVVNPPTSLQSGFRVATIGLGD